MHTPAPISSSGNRGQRGCSPEAARGGAEKGRPAPPPPPRQLEPRPTESGPSPPRRPSATPLTWRGWRRPRVGKTRRGCRELGRLSKSWGRVWLAGAPPAVSLGGALGGPLPALRVPCYRASGEDAPARRSPPGLHPARTTTLPRAAPLLFARPRPAPRPLGPGFPERPGSLQVPQTPAGKGGLPDVKAPRDSKGWPPCSAQTRFLRGDLSQGILSNFCFRLQSMECGWSFWARFINVKTLRQLDKNANLRG